MMTTEITSTHIGYPMPCLVVFADDGEFDWRRVHCVTLVSTAHRDTHQQRAEHHTSPVHVSETELKASENLPGNGPTFLYVTFTLYAIRCMDYPHLSDYL
jgi:hypothetical protein